MVAQLLHDFGFTTEIGKSGFVQLHVERLHCHFCAVPSATVHFAECTLSNFFHHLNRIKVQLAVIPKRIVTIHNDFRDADAGPHQCHQNNGNNHQHDENDDKEDSNDGTTTNCQQTNDDEKKQKGSANGTHHNPDEGRKRQPSGRRCRGSCSIGRRRGRNQVGGGKKHGGRKETLEDVGKAGDEVTIVRSS